MIPFILKQHEKDREILRELDETELKGVSGGRIVIKLPTVTVTGTRMGDGSDGSDGGDDGCDG